MTDFQNDKAEDYSVTKTRSQMKNKYTFDELQYSHKDILRDIEFNLRKAIDEKHHQRFAQIGRILFLQEELRKLEE